MKRVSIFIFIGICFLVACGQSKNNEQVIPPADSTSTPSSNMGTNNEQMTRNPGTAVRMGDGTAEESGGDSSGNQADSQQRR